MLTTPLTTTRHACTFYSPTFHHAPPLLLRPLRIVPPTALKRRSPRPSNLPRLQPAVAVVATRLALRQGITARCTTLMIPLLQSSSTLPMSPLFTSLFPQPASSLALQGPLETPLRCQVTSPPPSPTRQPQKLAKMLKVLDWVSQLLSVLPRPPRRFPPS